MGAVAGRSVRRRQAISRPPGPSAARSRRCRRASVPSSAARALERMVGQREAENCTVPTTRAVAPRTCTSTRRGRQVGEVLGVADDRPGPPGRAQDPGGSPHPLGHRHRVERHGQAEGDARPAAWPGSSGARPCRAGRSGCAWPPAGPGRSPACGPAPVVKVPATSTRPSRPRRARAAEQDRPGDQGGRRARPVVAVAPVHQDHGVDRRAPSTPGSGA